jgi:hypothetical protein
VCAREQAELKSRGFAYRTQVDSSGRNCKNRKLANNYDGIEVIGRGREDLFVVKSMKGYTFTAATIRRWLLSNCEANENLWLLRRSYVRHLDAQRGSVQVGPKPTEFGAVGLNWEDIGWRVREFRIACEQDSAQGSHRCTEAGAAFTLFAIAGLRERHSIGLSDRSTNPSCGIAHRLDWQRGGAGE